MCDICLHTPCLGACPNAPEPPIFEHCVECGEPIYRGDDYYELGGECYCETCVQNARKYTFID